MRYEDFLLNISKNDKFKIVQEKYDEAFFGNFHIKFVFCNNLNIEIISDRGIIEINILYTNLFFMEQIPLCFAVSFMQLQNQYQKFTFDTIISAQEFLFNSIDSLLLIVEKNLMKDIAKKWSLYKNNL